jgi:hypothetical protein
VSDETDVFCFDDEPVNTSEIEWMTSTMTSIALPARITPAIWMFLEIVVDPSTNIVDITPLSESLSNRDKAAKSKVLQLTPLEPQSNVSLPDAPSTMAYPIFTAFSHTPDELGEYPCEHSTTHTPPIWKHTPVPHIIASDINGARYWQSISSHIPFTGLAA